MSFGERYLIVGCKLVLDHSSYVKTNYQNLGRSYFSTEITRVVLFLALVVASKTMATSGKCFNATEMAELQKKLLEFEGRHTKAYDAQPKSEYVDWTIGVGFNLKRPDAKTVFNKVLPGVDFDSVYDGKAELTKEECMALFEYDLRNIYIARAEHVAGSKFCEFPTKVKIAIMSAVYRGDLAYGHKTAGYIRAGDWCKVRTEYLNNKEYKESRARGLSGIATRMEWNADQFDTMCKK